MHDFLVEAQESTPIGKESVGEYGIGITAFMLQMTNHLTH